MTERRETLMLTDDEVALLRTTVADLIAEVDVVLQLLLSRLVDSQELRQVTEAARGVGE